MKCPNCGTNNGRTNKFCRECGTRLEGLTEVTEHQDPQEQALELCDFDDVSLGEELFGVMRLYESGDLDSATERVDKIIECSPSSASAHSIRAIILERRADSEQARGNASAAQAYIEKAVAEYEAIIDLNPDSVADREKLIALRMKLAGNVISQPLSPVPQARASAAPVNRLRQALAGVPPPALAAGVTLVVLVFLLSILLPGGKGRPEDAAVSSASQEGLSVAATPAAPVQQPVQPYTGMGGYNYPPPAPVPSRAIPPVPQPAESSERTEVPPVRLPSIGRELVIAPEPREESRPDTPARTSPQPPAGESRTGTIRITPSAPAEETPSEPQPPAAPDGSTLLARAIDLSNQDRYTEAVQTAQQAAQMFQNDIAEGRNTTAAQRGLDNANKYIKIWRSM